MYGNTSQEDQIIFLAPATQMKPLFVERVEDKVLQQNTSDQNRILQFPWLHSGLYCAMILTWMVSGNGFVVSETSGKYQGFFSIPKIIRGNPVYPDLGLLQQFLRGNDIKGNNC